MTNENDLSAIRKEIHSVRNSLNAMNLIFESRHMDVGRKQTELEQLILELQNKVADLSKKFSGK